MYNDNNFQQSLAIGQLGESMIAQWLRRKGWHVLPTYEIEIDKGKGPRLFTAYGGDTDQLISPDLLAMKNGSFKWVEAKHKTRFSWYGIGKYFVTGVDIRHFEDYCKVADSTHVPVWMLFLHRDFRTWENDISRWGAPATCPVGLFGASIEKLRTVRSHYTDKHGHSGMVYWQPDVHLKLIAPLDEFELPEVAISMVQPALVSQLETNSWL
jgi:hypothetical protein